MTGRTKPRTIGAQMLRQWQLVIELRQGPRTKYALAAALGACHRTIYRDLLTLEAIGFPVIRSGGEVGDPALWSIGSMREWPRNAACPVQPFVAVQTQAVSA